MAFVSVSLLLTLKLIFPLRHFSCFFVVDCEQVHSLLVRNLAPKQPSAGAFAFEFLKKSNEGDQEQSLSKSKYCHFYLW